MRILIAILAATIVVTALASTAGAFTTSEKVIVANQLVAIARVPAGGFTADQRIDRVNERLAYILGYEPLHPRNIYLVRRGTDRIIMVGNRPLLTVTRRDARANGTTVDRLSRYWLQRAREVIPQARPAPVGV